LNEIATPLPGLAMTIKNSFHSDDRLKFSFIVACYSGDNCERVARGNLERPAIINKLF